MQLKNVNFTTIGAEVAILPPGFLRYHVEASPGEELMTTMLARQYKPVVNLHILFQT